MENEKQKRNFSQETSRGFHKPLLLQDQTHRSRYEKPKQRINITKEARKSSMEERNKSEKRSEQSQQSQEAILSNFQKAIMHNRITEVEEFIAEGMDANCRFSSGWTALMYASHCAHPDVVSCLLKNGADPNSHKDKYTSLMSACSSVGSDEQRVMKCVSQLLDSGADVNFYDRYEMSALMYAAREGRATVVQKLIEMNASVNNQDSKGNTALMWAAQRGHARVVRCLLDASADVNIQKADETTALCLALINKHNQVIEILKDLTNPMKQDCASFPSISVDRSMVDSPSHLPVRASESHSPQPNPHLKGSEVKANTSLLLLASSSETSSNHLGSDASDRKTDPPLPLFPANPAATTSRKLTCDASGGMALHNQGTVMSASCGDLELFLMGLDLGDLISLFHQNKIAFQEFLQMNDSDLCQLGIVKADARKRILDSINDTHRKKFKSASVPLAPYNKKISCFEGVAMLCNLKRHLGFAGSSVGYISDRINEDKCIVLDSPDPSHIRELCSSTEDALTSTGALYDELVGFRLQLQGLCPDSNFTPEDLTSFKKESKKPNVSWKRVVLMGGGVLTCIMTFSWLIKNGLGPVVIPVKQPTHSTV